MDQREKVVQKLAHSIWWVGNTGLLKSHYTFNVTSPDFSDPADRKAVLEMVRTGQSTPPEARPFRLTKASETSGGRRSDRSRVPHLFHASDLWFVSEAVKSVLDGFDLGSAQLSHVDLFENNGTSIDQGYYWLSPGNPQTTFLRDRSPAVLENDLIYGGTLPARSLASFSAFQDGDVSVSAKALDGPPIWVDPRFISTFFALGCVVEALREADVANDFHFRRAELF